MFENFSLVKKTGKNAFKDNAVREKVYLEYLMGKLKIEGLTPFYKNCKSKIDLIRVLTTHNSIDILRGCIV